MLPALKELEDNVGIFWQFVETRPNMRVRVHLADCQWRLGERDAAVVNHQESLRLNTTDNQGLRGQLMTWVRNTKRYNELEALPAEYENEVMVVTLYMRVHLGTPQRGTLRGSTRRP